LILELLYIHCRWNRIR